MKEKRLTAHSWANESYKTMVHGREGPPQVTKLDAALIPCFGLLSNNHFQGSENDSTLLIPTAHMPPHLHHQEPTAMQSFVAVYLDFGHQQLEFKLRLGSKPLI